LLAVLDGSDAEFESASSPDGFCTSSQSVRVHDLFGTLGVRHEKQAVTQAKRNANSVCNLTKDQAQEIIHKPFAAIAQVERRREAPTPRM